MGTPTGNGEPGTPPIDINALTSPDLRELMVSLGFPVSEHMTPQETAAARTVAQMLPDQAWALLLHPGMTVRLEGAQGLAENGIEVSLSRVQVAPGGERSQVLELSASMAAEAGLRSEALRALITPDLIERLPEGGEADRARLEKGQCFGGFLIRGLGRGATYQAVVPPDVGARIAAGEMSAAPGRPDEHAHRVFGADQRRILYRQSFSARYKKLHFDETLTSLEVRVWAFAAWTNIFEITTGPMEAMERDAFLGVGSGDLSVGISRETRLEGQEISVAQLDLSTPEGRHAYETYMQTGTVPTSEAPGVFRVGERGQLSVSDSASLALNAGPLGVSVGTDAALNATQTQWTDGTSEVQTDWRYPASGTYSYTHTAGADGTVDESSRRWTATFQGVDGKAAQRMYVNFSDAGGPRVGFPERVTVDMSFTESDLMQLRDMAVELNARPGQEGGKWERLAQAQTPNQVFREVFLLSNQKEASAVEGFFGALHAQSDAGALPGSLGFLSESSLPVQVSMRGQPTPDKATPEAGSLGGVPVGNYRLPDESPQVVDTIPGPVAPPLETEGIADLIAPDGIEPAPIAAVPPGLGEPPEPDAAPVVGNEPLPPVPPEGALPPVPPEGALPPVPPEGALPPVPPEGALPPVPPEGALPPVPPEGALPPVLAPGYDMQDGLLRRDEVGLGVLGLQTALKNQGFDLPTDGRFGIEVEQALRDFQARNGLQVDGIAGPETFAALGYATGSDMADGLIRQPDQGVGVLGTQLALRQLGHELAADSRFGPETERAVREFQQANGLAVDGIVGPKTSAALVAAQRDLSQGHGAAPTALQDRPSGPISLTPDQQRHLQLAHDQLAPALSARGQSPEQIERICAAAVGHAQQYAYRGPVSNFLLSKDGERVAVIQQTPPMSEMNVAAAGQRNSEQHLADAQQLAIAQGQTTQPQNHFAPQTNEYAR
ncbi:MAG: peptidoglycan-binding protein [Burkholderiaceae bacterium]